MLCNSSLPALSRNRLSLVQHSRCVWRVLNKLNKMLKKTIIIIRKTQLTCNYHLKCHNNYFARQSGKLLCTCMLCIIACEENLLRHNVLLTGPSCIKMSEEKLSWHFSCLYLRQTAMGSNLRADGKRPVEPERGVAPPYMALLSSVFFLFKSLKCTLTLPTLKISNTPLKAHWFPVKRRGEVTKTDLVLG